jgi:GSCFA family/Sulfotransferase family
MAINPYRGLPSAQYWRSGVADVGHGQFDPVEAVKFRISQADKISTLGSCFAQHLARHIHNSGYNYFVAEPLSAEEHQNEAAALMASQFSARYGNVYTVRQALQLLDRASGWTPEEGIWQREGRFYDAFRPNVFIDGFKSEDALVAARTTHLAAVNQVFSESDVVVFTLGLTEAWTSTLDGAVYPIAPGVVAGSMDESRHSFNNFTYPEVLSDLLAWCRRLRDMNQAVRILLTVSPVPLNATYVPRNVWVSTTYSKAVLRAAAGDVCRELKYVDYFPSYEIVTCPQVQGRYFEDDLREVRDIGVRHVMKVFRRHYFEGSGANRDKKCLKAASTSRTNRASQVSDVFCDENLLDDSTKQYPSPHDLAARDAEEQLTIPAANRLLFLHIPKTAGMSMRAYLHNQYLPTELFPPTIMSEAATFNRPLQDFLLYCGHYQPNFARMVPPGTRTLVILREPVSRLLSALKHMRRDPHFSPNHALARGKTLSALVGTPELMASQFNVQVNWLANVMDSEEANDYINDNPDFNHSSIEDPATQEARFQRAKETLQAIDFIGFTEDLRPVLAQLSDQMDFIPVISLPRLNDDRQDTAPTDQLSKADIALIDEATAWDQRLYNFAKDLVEHRRVQTSIKLRRDSGRYTTPESKFDITLQAPIPGVGWHAAETVDQIYHRWTGPEAHFTLHLPLASRPYAVQILFCRRADDADGVFTVRANMVSLVVEQAHVYQDTFQARFVIPTAVIIAGEGAVLLEMYAGATVRPSVNGELDDRLLGIAVFRIAFSPVSDAIEPEVLVDAIEPTAESAETIRSFEPAALPEGAQSLVIAEPVGDNANVLAPIIGDDKRDA